MTSAAFDLISLIRPATRPWARRYRCQIQHDEARTKSPTGTATMMTGSHSGRACSAARARSSTTARSVADGWESRGSAPPPDALSRARALWRRAGRLRSRNLNGDIRRLAVSRGDPVVGRVQERGDRVGVPVLFGELDKYRDQLAFDLSSVEPELTAQEGTGFEGDLMVLDATTMMTDRSGSNDRPRFDLGCRQVSTSSSAKSRVADWPVPVELTMTT